MNSLKLTTSCILLLTLSLNANAQISENPSEETIIVNENQTNEVDNNLQGTWHYESLEGLPGFESLNDCGKKSNISYSENNYHVQFYDNNCNLLTESGGTFELKGKIMKVTASAKDDISSTKITTTQTILEQSENRLVIRDDLTGAVITLVRKE